MRSKRFTETCARSIREEGNETRESHTNEKLGGGGEEEPKGEYLEGVSVHACMRACVHCVRDEGRITQMTGKGGDEEDDDGFEKETNRNCRL